MQNAIDRMVNRLQAQLPGKVDDIYLYGSAVLDDFRPGWSDLDLLCLTKEPLTDEEAEMLLLLRQTLTIRREPQRYREQPQIRRWLASLGPSVQRFADVLEEELNRGTGGSAV